MSLDPTASPWPGVLASVGVCLWMAALGAPLAAAAFRHRPRLVWPFYAPILGIAVVLLLTNLAFHVIPGAPGVWFGLVAPSAASLVILRRLGAPRRPSRRSALVLLAVGLLAVGVFALGYATRMHWNFSDYTWHYPLALRFAEGVFPPVTPFGVDASPGYHYGHHLLAASIIGTTGAMPWAAFDALSPFLVVALVLAVAGFAYDVGSPLLLALGLGATVGLFGKALLLGVDTQYLGGGVFLDPSIRDGAFMWMERPQWALALGFAVLVAAALHGGAGRRRALVLVAGAGVFALAEATVMLIACAALALVGGVRLLGLRGRERLLLAAALVASALLVVLAGGPVSDALFDRGGTAGMVRVAWERLAWGPITDSLRPGEPAGPALAKIGLILLIAVAAGAAWLRRSWGLAFLAAVGVFGWLEVLLLRSPVDLNNYRIVTLVQAVVGIGALAGLGALVGALPGRRRLAAAGAVGLLVLLPSSLPRAVAGTRLAFHDLATANPAADASGHHYRDRLYFGGYLEANWEFYAWLRRALPTEARLLTPEAYVSATASGIASPRSGRDFQVFSSWTASHVYPDALRFLHRDDLADLGITHLHVSDPMAALLSPAARRLLDDPTHFTLLTDIRTKGGRHRVFEVRPGAGTTAVDPSSYRALRSTVPPDAPIAVLGGPPGTHRVAVLSAFLDHDDLGAEYPSYFDRATRIPPIDTLTELPAHGVVFLQEPLEPTALGLPRDEALWRGQGLRAYDAAAAWSPIARVGPNPAPLPDSLRAICDAAPNGLLDLRLLGEPGASLTAGSATLRLTGLPQVFQVAVPDCGAFTLRADAAVAPFAQIRPQRSVRPVEMDVPIAALAFDGGVDGGRAIISLWYRNPDGVPFVTSTEFRLYEASRLGVGLSQDNPNPRAASVRWWPGPAYLPAPEQSVRIEFDARRLEINGDPGGGSASRPTPGQTYLLALTVAGVNPRDSLMEVQHIVPLARVVTGETGVAYHMLSGIVTIEHRAPGTIPAAVRL